MRAALVILSCCAALVAADASAQSSCSKIADDKERLACYDKTELESAEQNAAAPIEQTPNSRYAYARQLERLFLSNGISMTVNAWEEAPKDWREKHEKQKHLYPRLVIFGNQSRPLVFQVASNGVLKYAQALGFKSVFFWGTDGGDLILYDVSGAALPRCDVNSRLCL